MQTRGTGCETRQPEGSAVNYKLLLQYDGTEFHGWQIQEDQRTVQGELTQALSLIDGRSVNVHGSGRTDAGVHAEGQVASVEIQREISSAKLRAAINANIGRDVRVLTVEHVPDDGVSAVQGEAGPLSA